VTRILLADDHAILRTGVKEIVLREMRHVTCGEAENAEQVLSLVREEQWDLLILDIAMPGRGGLDVLSDIRMCRPKLPVLVLSMYPEDQYGKQVLKAGASGYLNKESAPGELIKAIRTVLAGSHYVSARMAERLATDIGPHKNVDLHDGLSSREFQVLCKISSGMTVGEIAESLQLSVPTVSTYRSRILEKLGLSTTPELIRYGIHHHLEG
jgi:two-component system invasion response regulator UvrY